MRRAAALAWPRLAWLVVCLAAKVGSGSAPSRRHNLDHLTIHRSLRLHTRLRGFSHSFTLSFSRAHLLHSPRGHLIFLSFTHLSCPRSWLTTEEEPQVAAATEVAAAEAVVVVAPIARPLVIHRLKNPCQAAVAHPCTANSNSSHHPSQVSATAAAMVTRPAVVRRRDCLSLAPATVPLQARRMATDTSSQAEMLDPPSFHSTSSPTAATRAASLSSAPTAP